jgi:hypothetical protein
LEQAHRIRMMRGTLKADLGKGKITLASVLSDPPDYLETAKAHTVARHPRTRSGQGGQDHGSQ